MIRIVRYCPAILMAYGFPKRKDTRIMKQKVNPLVVIVEDCIACQRCVAICPSFVLEMIAAKATVVRGDWCIGCQHCGAVRPTAAILHNGRFGDDPRFSRGEIPSLGPPRSRQGGLNRAVGSSTKHISRAAMRSYRYIRKRIYCIGSLDRPWAGRVGPDPRVPPKD